MGSYPPQRKCSWLLPGLLRSCKTCKARWKEMQHMGLLSIWDWLLFPRYIWTQTHGVLAEIRKCPFIVIRLAFHCTFASNRSCLQLKANQNFIKKLQSEKPSLNFKDRYSEAYRNSHPTAPVIVPWVSGVVSVWPTFDQQDMVGSQFKM